MASALRRSVVAGLFVVAVAAAVFAVVLSARRPAAGRTAQAPTAAVETPELPVIARVGDVAITAADLARYEAFHSAAFGVVGDREALSALCDRALLLRMAKEQGVALADAEVTQAVLRGTLLLAAGRSGHELFRPAERTPLDAGAVRDEAAADALAQKVRRQLVGEAQSDLPHLMAALHRRWPVELLGEFR